MKMLREDDCVLHNGRYQWAVTVPRQAAAAVAARRRLRRPASGRRLSI